MTLTDLSDHRADDLPLALARLHRATDVGDRLHVTFPEGLDHDVAASGFTRGDLITGGGFRADGCDDPVGDDAGGCHLIRLRTLPDTVAADMTMLVVGLNPSVYSADAGAGFARPGNRFWPAMIEAGLVTVARDTIATLVDHGIGMTDAVKRATPRSAELARDEYVEGFERLERLVTWLSPGVVCMVGLEGWRLAVDRRASVGLQDDRLGGRPVYVMGSTSGLNAHQQLPAAAAHLEAAFAIGADGG
ncbi:MAG: mismatch-specific DNA-glycosylase [Acidimicrobiales bacterium]